MSKQQRCRGESAHHRPEREEEREGKETCWAAYTVCEHPGEMTLITVSTLGPPVMRYDENGKSDIGKLGYETAET